MSQEQDKQKPGEGQDEAAPGHSSQPGPGAFVPDIARQPEDEELYLRRDDDQDKRRWRVPALGWFVFAGLLIGVIIVVLKIFLHEPPSPEEQSNALQQELAEPGQGELKQVRSTLERMNDCTREYLGATDIGQKLAHARHPRRVKPLMEQYYKNHPMAAQQFHQFETYRAVVIDNGHFVLGSVVMADGSKQDLLLEQLQSGSFKVDWESDVCYQAMPWEEFIIKRPAEPLVMRVIASPDNFYAYGFDEERYDCFQLTTRGSDDYVFGYTLKGGEASIAMRTLFLQARKLTTRAAEPVTLVLRFPEDSRSNRCVHIDRMMAPRWIFVNEQEARRGN